MSKRTMKCPICQAVTQVKSFSIITFLFLLLFGVFPGIIYLIFRVFGSKKCLACGNRI